MNRKQHLFLAVVVCMITLWSCKDSSYYYQAQAVDLTVSPEGETFSITGASALQLPDTFVWGGSPIKIEDKYYLFFSAWESGKEIPKFSDSWVLYSKIGVAVSDQPDRNFKKLDIFLKGKNHKGDSTAWDAQSAHNPLIKKFNNKYYLYYVSSVDPGKQPQGSPGAELSKRNRVQQNQKIGVVVFNSIEELLAGNYTRSEQPLLSPRSRVKKDNVVNPSPPGTKAQPDNLIVVNPAVVYRPTDGKYLLFFKGNMYDPHWRGVHGVAIGDSPAGPFTTTNHFVFDIDDGSGEKVSAEDPYVWYHRKDECFYAVVKDFTGKLTKSEPGLAMLRSEDGIDWKLAEQPLFMKKELILKNGTTLKVDRLERPQLLINENGEPEVLYAACSIDPCNQKQDGGTFNVHIPLKLRLIKNDK
uniref:glycoside hydrolase family protein n=1 Tax=uncultured Draconibacterium sp. TaxID=1573823 RepID=UPI0032163EFD